MKILYSTMGSFFKVFFEANDELKKSISVEGIFYASDKRFFQKYIAKSPLLDSHVVKEWDLHEKALNQRLNQSEINRLEELYFKDESLWDGIINDRRIYLGIYCKHKQDETSSFSEDEMLKFFQFMGTELEQFLSESNPDTIISFAPTTLGEYLLLAIAKSKKIKTLILRHSKIRNYITFTSNLKEDYPIIKEDFLAENYLDSDLKIAQEYIKEFKIKNGVSYEGNVRNIKFNIKAFFLFPLNLTRNIVFDIRSFFLSKPDVHSRGLATYKFLLDGVLRELNKGVQSFRLRKKIIVKNQLKEGKYIYFPLHSQPEIALTLFSKGYYNQIEVIRTIAHSLPAGYKLLINEHPRNIGRRSISFYSEILNIPMVRLADFSIPTYRLIKQSKLVIILSGFVGFEAVLHNKPILSLGNVMFNMLPKTMVNNIQDHKQLNGEIKWSLKNHLYEEEIVTQYLASIIKNSVSINLYNVLLNKAGRQGVSVDSDFSYESNLKQLVKLIKSYL